MKVLVKKQILSALVLSGAVFMSGNVLATEFPMDDKLKQCEMAFNKAHSGQMSQMDAAKANREHRDLMLEILENLNKRNTEIPTQTGGAMSNKGVIDNFRVMGRLLEMLAADHQPKNYKSWGDYAYE